ncbi:MAG: hypothetical protein K8M05_02670, partial [Deltaproteobacteria bacterium]|nr:hypothetical protein [Kofleriaceae bacterium]
PTTVVAVDEPDPDEIEMPVAIVGESPPPAPPPTADRGKPAATIKRPPPRDKPDKNAPEVVAPDERALTAKFRAATREYKAYKERNGSRLEAEWTDLASMVGYLSTPEKRIAFDKKIDRLRAKMRE